MNPSLSIAGRVVDAAGRGVPDAAVAVTSSTQPHRDLAAITRADGAFRLSGMRPGTYALEARKGSASGGVHVEVNPQTAMVEIRLG